MKRTLIGGIGNVLLGDDGIGPYVARLLDAEYEFPDEVRVEDLGTPGLDLIAHFCDADSIILVDCVDDGKEPGTITVFDRTDILNQPSAPRLDPHSPALSESLRIAEMCSDATRKLYLVGVTAASFDSETILTSAVADAVPRVIDQVLGLAASLGHPARRRRVARQPDFWWAGKA